MIGLFCAPLIAAYQHLTISTLTSSASSLLTPSLFTLMLLQAIGNILLYVLVLTIFFFFCLKQSFLTAAYYASCAYLVQDFAYTLFVWLRPDAAHRNPHPIQLDSLWLELLLMFLCNAFFYLYLSRKNFIYAVRNSERVRALGYLLLMLCCGRTMGTCPVQSELRILRIYSVFCCYTICCCPSVCFWPRVCCFRKSSIVGKPNWKPSSASSNINNSNAWNRPQTISCINVMI